MIAGILIAAALITLVILRTGIFRDDHLSRRWLLGIFSLRILAGITAYLIYAYYYGNRENSDMFKYFDDSAVLFNACFSNPSDFLYILTGAYDGSDYWVTHYFDHMTHWLREWERPFLNDNHTIIRMHAVVRFFSFGNYHIHSLIFNFMAFTGLFLIYRAIKPLFKGKEFILALVILLVPSVLFWTSAPFKETILMFGLGCGLFGAVGLANSDAAADRIKEVMIMIIGLILLMSMKYYVLLCSLPPALAFYLANKYRGVPIYMIYGLVLALSLGSVLAVRTLAPDYDIIHAFYKKQDDFVRLGITEKAGSMLNVTILSDDVWSFVCNAPEALYHTLLSPFFNDGLKSPFVLIASLENLALLALAAVCLMFSLKPNRNAVNFILAAVFFTIALYLIIGWTTPVMGAIVRYKVPALPFLAAAFLIFLNPDKLKKYMPWV